jgi:hypothetical protein
MLLTVFLRLLKSMACSGLCGKLVGVWRRMKLVFGGVADADASKEWST